MFENAKQRDLYKTSVGQKAFYWFYSPYTKKHYLTIEGAHPGLVVNDDGKNSITWNDEYESFEKYLKIDIVGKWEAQD